MDFIIILQAGVASGTVLLFAALGEILAERSGVLNLGVEGMMLIGAMSAFSTTIATGNPWLGVLVAMFVAGLLSQIHAFIVITLQAGQVVSGLALTLLGQIQVEDGGDIASRLRSAGSLGEERLGRDARAEQGDRRAEGGR